MLDMLRKPVAFKVLERFDETPVGFNQKLCQQLAVRALISDMNLSRIAAVGPAAQECLLYFHQENECFELFADGAEITGYRKIGDDGSGEVKPIAAKSKRFDVVFSCGLMDSTPNEKLAELPETILDLLSPGGLMIHTLQFYISDYPTNYWIQRLKPFIDLLARDDLEGIGPVMTGDELRFSTDMATTPDGQMYRLYRAGGSMAELRAGAQNVCLVFAARKLF